MEFKQFDSVEDAFDWMEKNERRVNQNLHPVQKNIKRGQYVMRPAPEVPCVIFGYLFTEEEIRAGEEGAGADPDELEWTMQALEDSYARGYRFGRWYSIVEPTGELGDAHVANLWPISVNDFVLAEMQKWEVTPEQYQTMLIQGYTANQDPNDPTPPPEGGAA